MFHCVSWAGKNISPNSPSFISKKASFNSNLSTKTSLFLDIIILFLSLKDNMV